MTQDRILALERAEMEAFASLYRSASSDVAAETGLSVTEIDGNLLFVATRIDVLTLNRLVGLGLNAPVSDGSGAHQAADIAAAETRELTRAASRGHSLRSISLKKR